ncbi:MAG: D-tyrosyl-tRNA(Tyr) deacylase [Luminiphilus sp.]|nr:D-tyrosyl-tRNA(Tyr) deacylase [Luminiphilus sp.]MBL6897382.1 D-tyrosyl-tRNA(Tyr) deacylase [Luminiphilus sp.]
MKCLLQRVAQASVTVDQGIVGEIQRGLLVFVGVEPGDTDQSVLRMAKRIVSYRIFPDDAGKMNLNVQQAGGAILLVSQFTLAADTTTGNRPSFSSAAPPEQAARLCEDLAKALAIDTLRVEVGQFGADMQVALVNDGPVTFLLSV